MRPRASPASIFSIASLLLASLQPSVGHGRAADVPTVTFFVASDSHFGARGMGELNRVVVEQMNALPGTPYPPEIGGRVDTPRGVLFTGDTTDNGHLEEFAEFEEVYGLTGRDGLLRFPVFEAIGNHDLNRESPIRERVAQRHGGIDYAWDWADLRLVCLDMYPDARTIHWLARELRALGPGRPVIPFFHYSLGGRTAISGKSGRRPPSPGPSRDRTCSPSSMVTSTTWGTTCGAAIPCSARAPRATRPTRSWWYASPRGRWPSPRGTTTAADGGTPGACRFDAEGLVRL
jgi:hypothetical protein